MKYFLVILFIASTPVVVFLFSSLILLYFYSCFILFVILMKNLSIFPSKEPICSFLYLFLSFLFFAFYFVSFSFYHYQFSLHCLLVHFVALPHPLNFLRLVLGLFVLFSLTLSFSVMKAFKALNSFGVQLFLYSIDSERLVLSSLLSR